MKVVIVFCAIAGLILAVPVSNNTDTPTYFLYERSDGRYAIEDLTNTTIEVYAAESDITYYFYSLSHKEGVSFKCTDVANLRSITDYDTSKNTFFIIHGWNNNYQSDVNTDITNALMTAGDFNIFVVDWSPITSKTYITAQSSVVAVGNFVGDVINQLNAIFGQSFQTLTVAGHSLGAHVAGNAGAACGGKIGTLVGMDPAGPLFIASNTANRIDPTDGVRVEIIHTNGGKLKLGYFDPMGHVDYYPNGGQTQPGCGTDLAGTCAHSRSYKYYAESLNNNQFLSERCDSYNDFMTAVCAQGATSYMGGHPITSADGTFYLETNSNSPYGKGSIF